jgi:hypothetical protein
MRDQQSSHRWVAVAIRHAVFNYFAVVHTIFMIHESTLRASGGTDTTLDFQPRRGVSQ